jgi:glyoxalase family protein
MERLVTSLHHVTATVTNAQEDLDHYIGVLGLRLVKKTVNFDNHNVYHFYYGDEVGSPSTIMTTFPYEGWGVPVGTKGAGQITVTSFSVPDSSLGFWEQRLSAAGVGAVGVRTPAGEDAIEFDDPSGLHLRLVGTKDDERAPWLDGGIAAGAAIRGLHTVTLSIREPDASVKFLTDVLGFEVTEATDDFFRLGAGSDGSGRVLDIVRADGAPAAVNGLGTVHHVALAIADGEEQKRIRETLLGLGYKVTEVRDRQYFTSIYFREPGGVLYEIATMGPGFRVDEDGPQLGCGLMLPPWEEPNRPTIEEHLPPVRTR